MSDTLRPGDTIPIAAPKPLPEQKVPFACILRTRGRYSLDDYTYCKRAPAAGEFTISPDAGEIAIRDYGTNRRSPFYVCVECAAMFAREHPNNET